MRLSELAAGTLALADRTGRTRWVCADDLSRLFVEHHTLRLVVLNACDTGRSGAFDTFSTTAGALVRRWIPAVLAMHFEICGLAAIRFAQTFYESVAKRRPVDDLRPLSATLSGDHSQAGAGSSAAPAVDPIRPRVHGRPDPGLDEAIKMFTLVVEVDSDYRDAGQRLDDARRRQQSAGLQAEARRLYQAEQWAAVVKIGEQLSILDPAEADPDELVSSARAQLVSADGRRRKPRSTAVGCACSTLASGSRRSRPSRGWTTPIGMSRLCWLAPPGALRLDTVTAALAHHRLPQTGAKPAAPQGGQRRGVQPVRAMPGNRGCRQECADL